MSLEDFFSLCIQQIILHAYNKSKISTCKMIDCKQFAFVMYQFVVKNEFLIIICWLLHKC